MSAPRRGSRASHPRLSRLATPGSPRPAPSSARAAPSVRVAARATVEPARAPDAAPAPGPPRGRVRAASSAAIDSPSSARCRRTCSRWDRERLVHRATSCRAPMVPHERRGTRPAGHTRFPSAAAEPGPIVSQTPERRSADAARATILAVDDDPQVSRARSCATCARATASDYRVVRATSGDEALGVLAELALRGRPVALIASDQRMPDMTGIELLEQVRETVARHQAAAAHRLRRHRRRHQGDQRHRPRLLPAQAVGPARGAALPGRRRPARATGARTTPTTAPTCGSSATVVRPQLRGQDVPGAQPRALPLARPRARRGGAAAARARRRRPDDLPLVLVPEGDPLRAPDHARRSPTRSGCAPAPSSRSTTCASSAAGRPAWPPRCTRRPRGCAPSSSSATPPAGRPARAPPSRTTSASRRGSPAPTSPTGRSPRPPRFGAEMVLARDVVGLEQRGPVRAVRFADGGEIEAGPCSSPPGVSYRRLEARGVDELGSARRVLRRHGQRGGAVRGRRRVRRRRGELGRPGGAQLRRYASRVVLLVRGAAPRGLHVGVPRRPDPGRRQRRGAAAAPRSSRPTATDHLESLTLADRDTGAERRTCRPTGCSCSSARSPAPTGSATPSSATRKGFVVTGHDLQLPEHAGALAARRGRRTRSRRASPGSSPPATCGSTR